MIDGNKKLNSYISFYGEPIVELKDAITLSDWLKIQKNNFEFNQDGNKDKLKKATYQALSQKLDAKTKYIHKQQYYIESYLPKDIYLTKEDEIIYIKIAKMPATLPEQEQLRTANLNKQALLLLGIYADCLEHLKGSFVKDNFDAFSIFLPEEDVPYYKGIFERGATVYLNDFTKARAKQELMKFGSDLKPNELTSNSSTPNNNASGPNNSRGLVKSTAAGRVYAEENENRSAAFVSLYFYIILGVVAIGSIALLILGKILK